MPARKPEWQVPRYCIVPHPGDMVPSERRPWMRRRECCDCHAEVLVIGLGVTWELVRPYVFICNRCAQARTLAAGGLMWTYEVGPRAR